MDIGGQALIEGVMIKTKDKIAISIRKKDHIKTVNLPPLKISKKLSKIPLLRGIIALIDTLYIGTKALMFSAKEQETQEEEKITDLQIFITIIISFILGIGLFIVLPLILSKLITEDRFLFNLIDGLLKIILFVGYLAIISFSKDVKRIFQYHGAEHMSVHCFEAKKELTIKNCRNFSPIHPRCGTSFIIIVLLLSIILFSFIWHESFFYRLIYRILLIPLIAASSYEFLKLSAKYQNNLIVKILAYPGLLVQKITTRQPDNKQIEVAIASVKAAVN